MIRMEQSGFSWRWMMRAWRRSLFLVLELNRTWRVAGFGSSRVKARFTAMLRFRLHKQRHGLADRNGGVGHGWHRSSARREGWLVFLVTHDASRSIAGVHLPAAASRFRSSVHRFPAGPSNRRARRPGAVTSRKCVSESSDDRKEHPHENEREADAAPMINGRARQTGDFMAGAPLFLQVSSASSSRFCVSRLTETSRGAEDKPEPGHVQKEAAVSEDRRASRRNLCPGVGRIIQRSSKKCMTAKRDAATGQQPAARSF